MVSQILPPPGELPHLHWECTSSIIGPLPAELKNILTVKWYHAFQNSHVMIDDADIPLWSCGQVRIGFLLIAMGEMRVSLLLYAMLSSNHGIMTPSSKPPCGHWYFAALHLVGPI